MAIKKQVTAKQSTALSTEFTKDQVPVLIETLKEKLKSLKDNSEKKVSTDVTYNGENVGNCTEVSRLLEMSASVHAREKAYNQEIERYNLEEKPIKKFEQDGKSVKTWESIFTKAINDLINKSEITKVENAIKKLSAHLDENTKLQNELAEIMASAEAPIR